MPTFRSLALVALISLAAGACTPAPSQNAAPSGQSQGASESPDSPGGGRGDMRDPSPSPTRGSCENHGDASHPGRVDAPWKKRIVTITRKHSVGVAVGIHGEVIYSHGGSWMRVPASNEKLLLTMALFDELGPNYRITTKAGSETKPSDGVVNGDLWLVGGGDPSLTDHQHFYWGSDFEATSLRSLARRVAGSGVKHVTGRVMGADTYFDHHLDAPGWHSYIPYSYVEPLTSLSVNGNNAIRHHQELKAAEVFAKELRKLGVTIGHGEGAGAPPGSLLSVAKVRSETLRTLADFMDENSNNFFAEMFGKLLGAKTFGPPGTIAKGARAIERWVAEHGGHIVAHDSSGLSYENRVSPETIVHLLGAAEKQPWIGALRGDLPAAGQGTLHYRLPGIKLRAKTGTLFAGASALSGWVRSHGRWVEFSILDNLTPKAVEDRIVTTLARPRIHAPPTC